MVALRPAVWAGAGPLIGAIGVELVLPDGNAGFDLIDEIAVRIEGCFTMRGSGESDDGGLADF